MNIPYVDLSYKKKTKKKIISVFNKILNSGEYVGGNEIKKFEENIAELCETKYAVSLNSGTDALTLALYVLGVKRGDEVITPPNSFIASTAAIVHIGAKPVFADVLEDQNIDPENINKLITKKTKVIMPVHLTGRMSRMDDIVKIAKKNNLKIIEDAAQSIGSKYNNKPSGSYGDIGCFSAHPLKNLNALGDAGYITTNNYEFYKKIKILRSHGISNRNKVRSFGYVSRMDNMQAAFLNLKLKELNSVVSIRRKNANLYFQNIKEKNILLPYEKHNEFNTYHTFVIQCKFRNQLKKYLLKNGVHTAIHYPIPIHLQPAAKYLGYKKGDFEISEKQSKEILSLPINENLKDIDIRKISNLVNNFYN
jgi:dTDP-4-amino-4,6-dideoxygalactose transaminase